MKCSSASASLPGGLPLSFGVILIVTVTAPCSFAVTLAASRQGIKEMPGRRCRGRVAATLLARCGLMAVGGIADAAPGASARRRGTTTARCSAAEEQHLGERQRVGMRDGQQRRAAADRREPPRGAAVKLQLRRAAAARRPRRRATARPASGRCRAPSSPLPSRRSARRNEWPARAGACSTRFRPR